MRSVWPSFFVKQRKGDFYRLGEKIKIAQNCLSRKFAAKHREEGEGENLKNVQRAFLSVWGYVKDDGCHDKCEACLALPKLPFDF